MLFAQSRDYILNLFSMLSRMNAYLPLLVLLGTVHQLIWQDRHRLQNCEALLRSGRWTHQPSLQDGSLKWHPNTCILHTYHSSDIRKCLKSHHIGFSGDSTARQVFQDIAAQIDHSFDPSAFEKHEDMNMSSSNVNLHFTWDPFLNRTRIWKGSNIIGSGLWHTRYLADSEDMYEHSIRELARKAYNQSHTSVIVLPIVPPCYTRLSPARQATITATRVGHLRRILQEMEMPENLKVAHVIERMASGTPALFASDGIHLRSEIVRVQGNMLLNRVCNPVLQEHQTSLNGVCCTKPSVNKVQIRTVGIIVVVLISCQVCLASRSVFNLRHKDLSHSSKLPFDDATKNIINSISTISTTLLFSFLSDRTALFDKTNKVLDSNLFMFACALSLIAGLSKGIELPNTKTYLEIRPRMFDELLPRPQSDEWKGWMQFVILSYHYFGMSRNLSIYRFVRTLVAAYLFLTGYGHTQYFLRTYDFSLRRVVAVLLRLNLLSVTLAYTMGTRWDFYYFPALSSFWFIAVHLTLWGSTDRSSASSISIRILLSALVMTMFTKPGSLLEYGLAVMASLGGPHLEIRESLFRINTDLYSPFVGMVVAVAQVKQPEWIKLIQTLVIIPKTKFGQYLSFGLTLTTVTGYCILASTFHSKQSYNRFHAYASPLAILSYLLLRNLTAKFRNHYSKVFAWLGRCSLETFVLQYHIWLAGDTKGVLHIGILDRSEHAAGAIVSFSNWRYWLEKLFLTAVFLWTSNCVAKSTSVICDALVRRRN